MIRRISRSSALNLIKQIKSVEISASLFNPKSKSAFELLKQMQSTKFVELNPKYECTFNNLDNEKDIPLLKVEFINKMTWEIETSDYTAQRLRESIFTKAHDVEILDSIANADKPEDL